LALFPSECDVLVQIHFVSFHEQQQGDALFALFALAAKSLPVAPPRPRSVQTDPQQRWQASVADAVDPLEQLDRFLLEGDFLDDIGEFGLSVDITAHEIFAPAD
jgi:hypothetical protein